MSALPVVLAAVVSVAAQVPAAPAAPAWPEGVSVKVRAELPLVVAALAVPMDQPPPLLPLIASWLAQPESWPEGPVTRLLAAGGRVRARAFADGLVVVTEGAAEQQADVIAAALALLSDASPSARGLEPARAEALAQKSLALGDEEARARQALWRAWYGEPAARARGAPADRALLSATEEQARAALADVRERSFGHRLFLEGAVRADALPLVVGTLRPAWAPAGPPSLPRPVRALPDAAVVDDDAPGAAGAALLEELPAAQEPPALEADDEQRRPPGPLVVVGHPLPPGPWSTEVGAAFTRALARRLAPLGEVSVDVEPGRHARLLVVTLRPAGAPRAGPGRDAAVAEARDAIEAALHDARTQAPTDRALADDLVAGAAAIAREERRLGGWAERRARVHLTRPHATEPPADDGVAAPRDQLVGLLRITVMPEALRQVALPPAAPRRPAAGARSAASGTGPG